LNPSREKFSEGEEAIKTTKKRCRNRCVFCSPYSHLFPLEPMNIPLLTQFMTTSGTILPRRVNGVCKKIQSRVSRTIKHSRTLGLFSYKKGTFTIHNPAYIDNYHTGEKENPDYSEMEKEYNEERSKGDEFSLTEEDVDETEISEVDYDRF